MTTYKGCGGSDTRSDPSAAVGSWSSESESDSANGGWLWPAVAATADWLLAAAAGTSAPRRTSWAASASSSWQQHKSLLRERYKQDMGCDA